MRTIRKNRTRRLFIFVPLIVVAVVIGYLNLFSSNSPKAEALSGADFNPGRIIDDYVFYNDTSMSATLIQSFLQARVANCDTWGSHQASEFGRPDLTRAQYAASQGWHSPPYTCLKDYRQDTPAMEAASGLCEGLSAKANRSASEIIKDVATACHINPQVLLVLLQKEQSLVTDTWPLNGQYTNATGFACPDTAPCNPAFGGFFYQVYYAARQFQIYKLYPNNYNYIAGRNNNIYFHPDLSRCGSSSIYIQNQATAALYIYTPYQPNGAALNNLYGTGDSCSSYGNRNFWRLFSDWFQSTYANQQVLQNITIDQSLQVTPSTADSTNQVYTASFRLRNNSLTTSVNLGYMFVSVRDIDGNNLDFPARDIIVGPGQTYTYNSSRTFPLVGKLRAFIGGNITGIGWTNDAPYSSSDSIVRQMEFFSGTSVASLIDSQVRLTESLRISPTSSTDPNQVYTATFKLKNNSTTTSVNLGFMFAAVRDSNGNNLDFPIRNIVLAPGQTYTYSASRTFSANGKLTTYIGGKFTQLGWRYDVPTATSGSIVRERAFIPRSDVVMTGSGISVSQISGNQYRATATFKNNTNTTRNIGWFLVSARTPSGENVDFPVQNIIIPANSTVTYNQTRSFDLAEQGRFTFFANLNDPLDGYGWTTTYPASETNNARRTTSFLNGPSVVQTKEVQTQTMSDGSIRATVEFTNYGTSSEYLGWVILSTRLDGKSVNYDFQPQEVTLSAGETRTLTFTKRFVKAGDYSINLVFHRWPNWWSQTYAPLQKTSMSRTAEFTSTYAVEQVGDIGITRNGNTATGTITLRNTTNQRVEVGSVVMSVRDGSQTNLDFPMVWVVLEPNQTRTFSATRTLTVGTYRVTATAHHYYHGWGATFLVNTNRDYTL